MDDAKAMILALAARRAEALCDRDGDVLRELLAPAFVYTNAHGTRLDRDGWLAFVLEGRMRWASQTLEDVEVLAFGDTVVLTGRVADVGEWDGEPVRWVFATTQIYVRQGGVFRYAAGHTGPIEP
jgi:hypothetical protein